MEFARSPPAVQAIELVPDPGARPTTRRSRRAPAPPADRRGDGAPRRHPRRRGALARGGPDLPLRQRGPRAARGRAHRDRARHRPPRGARARRTAGAAEAAGVEPDAAARRRRRGRRRRARGVARGRARAEPRARPWRPPSTRRRCRRRGRSRSSCSTAAATSTGRARSRAGSRRSRTRHPRRQGRSFNYPQTQVYFPPGGEAIGLRLAKQLDAPLQPLPGGPTRGGSS